MWEYSLSLRRCLAGRLQGCLRPWITVWCQASSPPRPCGRWSGGQPAEVGAAFPVCACMSLRKWTPASPSHPILNTQESGECPASGWLWGVLWRPSAPGWRCLHHCMDPGSNLVLSAACLYFSGRLSHRGVGRGDGKVRGAPVDCGPEGESWGGIAEW